MAHCSTSPDRVAVIHNGVKYTFSDLHDAVTRTSASLRALGLGRGTSVLIVADSGFDALACMLGVLRCGAMYVPISSDYPADKLNDVLSTLAPSLIVTREEARSPGYDRFHVVSFGRLAQRDGIPDRKPARVSPDDPAYTIFTSGTTGKPKGIVMTHRSATTYLQGIRRQEISGAADVLVSISPFQFDLSLIDLAVSIGCGAAIAFYTRSQIHLVARFLDDTARCGATMISAAPSLWTIVQRAGALERARHFVKVLSAGEAFPEKTLDGLRRTLPHTILVNIYGQSESIACMVFIAEFASLDPEVPLSVGEPVDDFAVKLLEPTNGGIVIGPGEGELYISGPGLFKFYIDDEAATARALTTDRDGTLWFKTGDLCLRGKDGRYTFLRRIDRQVQINGFRVELDEIEKFYGGMLRVRKAVAVEDEGSISVYLETDDEDIVVTARHRTSKLPHYMRPRIISSVPLLPVTSGGKVDIAALRQGAA